MQFRYVFMLLGSILTIFTLIATDPTLGLVQNLPVGGGTLATIIILATSTMYIAMLYLGRRAILDWINLAEYFKVALRNPEGAGLALIAVALMMISISIVILAATS